MNAHEAIAIANQHKMCAPNMLELLDIIAKAAVVEGNKEADRFLWLCHWRPQHRPN